MPVLLHGLSVNETARGARLCGSVMVRRVRGLNKVLGARPVFRSPLQGSRRKKGRFSLLRRPGGLLARQHFALGGFAGIGCVLFRPFRLPVVERDFLGGIYESQIHLPLAMLDRPFRPSRSLRREYLARRLRTPILSRFRGWSLGLCWWWRSVPDADAARNFFL